MYSGTYWPKHSSNSSWVLYFYNSFIPDFIFLLNAFYYSTKARMVNISSCWYDCYRKSNFDISHKLTIYLSSELHGISFYQNKEFFIFSRKKINEIYNFTNAIDVNCGFESKLQRIVCGQYKFQENKCTYLCNCDFFIAVLRDYDEVSKIIVNIM